MTSLSLQKLIAVLNAECLGPIEPASAIDGLTIDSRTIRPGQAFFALKGERFDGHDFAAEVANKAAACIVAERRPALPSDNTTPVLLVPSVLGALATLAGWYRHELSAYVIAITGSAGKTTTRHILHHVLSRFYRCHQAVKSFNNHIGVPLSILGTPPDCQVLLLELGSNHPGEIEPLARLAEPNAACITLIGPAHLEGFGNMQNILVEKTSIAKGLKADGVLYVNGDQPALAGFAKTLGCRVKTFGTTVGCDIIGTDLIANGLTGQLRIDGKTVDVPLPGRANLMNVLTVWSICRDLKIELSDFSEAVKTVSPVPMRLAAETIGRITLLNDCYNANPASMSNALETLSRLAGQTKQRAVFIAGSMAELGEQAEQLHYQLGRQAATAGVGCLLACGPFARAIIDGAREAGMAEADCYFFADTTKLCDKLHLFIRPDDIILVKGSRANGLEAAVETLKQLNPTTQDKAHPKQKNPN